MGQPLLVLAEIEKVPDLQKTSTISSYLETPHIYLLTLLSRVPATSCLPARVDRVLPTVLERCKAFLLPGAAAWLYATPHGHPR